MPRIARLAAVIVLSLSACAPARTDVASAAAPAATGRGPGGVIVTIRPMTATSDAILVALNEGGAARSGRSGAAMEFIIREDGGRTISVVQTDPDGFRPGEHVALTGGPRTRIARLPG
jgi:outer membrane lipoprotein SlyB